MRYHLFLTQTSISDENHLENPTNILMNLPNGDALARTPEIQDI